MKTRILSIVMATVLLITSASCSLSQKKIPGPETVLESYIQAVNKADFESAASFTTNPNDTDLGLDENNKEEMIGLEIMTAMLKTVKVKSTDNIEINGRKASLSAVISSPDTLSIFKTAQSNLEKLTSEQDSIQKLLEENPSFATDTDALAEYLTKVMMDEIKAAYASPDVAMLDETVTVEFLRVGSEWKITADSANEFMTNSVLKNFDQLNS